MKTDAYAPCPGGLKKKIKFCCHDLVQTLGEIQVKLDADQHVNALQQIDRQLERTPDRPCLMALRIDAIRETDETGEAHRAAVREFFEKFPDNPIACAHTAVDRLFSPVPTDDHTSSESRESALQRREAARKVVREAADLLQRAISESGDEIPYALYLAIAAGSLGLFRQAHVIAGRDYLFMATKLSPEDDSGAAKQVTSFFRDRDVSLLYKEEWSIDPPPDGVSWKGAYLEAAKLARRGSWLAALERFQTLIAEHGKHPALLEVLARLAGATVRYDVAIEAAEDLARFTDDRFRRLDALAMAIELRCTLGEFATEWVHCQAQFEDGSRALEILQSRDDVLVEVFTSPLEWNGPGPAPRGIVEFIDRPKPSPDEALTATNAPRVLWSAPFFGKETDRPARLEWNASESQIPQQIDLLRMAVGDLSFEVVTKFQALQPHDHHLEKRRIPTSKRIPLALWLRQPERELAVEALTRWLDTPLKALGGISAREAAQNPALRTRVDALLWLLESQCIVGLEPEDFDEKRQEIGLTPLGMNHPLAEIPYDIPATRLARIHYQDVDDKRLQVFFQYAIRVHNLPAIERIGEEIARRGTCDEFVPPPLLHSILSNATDDLDKKLARLQKARQASIRAGESPAGCLIHEISLRLQHYPDQNAEWQSLVSDLLAKHGDEPGVREALTEILYAAGILRPERRGGRTGPMPAMGPEALATESIVAAAPSTRISEFGDTTAPAGESAPREGAPPKLWLPGQD